MSELAVSKSVRKLVVLNADGLWVGGVHLGSPSQYRAIRLSSVKGANGPVVRVEGADGTRMYVYAGRRVEKQEFGTDLLGRSCAPKWNWTHDTVAGAIADIDRAFGVFKRATCTTNQP